MEKGKLTGRKVIAMILGILIMSAGVAIFKESGLGNDPQNSTLMRISDLTGISFGNMVVGMSGLYFILELACGRKYIGIGTFVNWLGCGYVITWFYGLLQHFFGTPADLGQQLLWVIPGVLVMGLGVSLYQTANLGIAPYDYLALFLQDHSKFPYLVCRVATDGFFAVVCACIGGLLGLGTIICALCLGPFVAFFDRHISRPFVEKE